MPERDAERTKAAILAAAEDLFARHGYEATSMHEVGDAAGFARSTPAYFFGCKEALYDAVLARAVARGRQAMARVHTDGADSAEDAVDAYIGAFVDFLGADQNFLRLIQREALTGGSRITEFFGRWVEEAVAALGPAAEKAGISPERLVLDLVALCWYPFAHEHTLLPALGMNVRDPAFVAEHKRHLGALVRAMAHTSGERRSRP